MKSLVQTIKWKLLSRTSCGAVNDDDVEGGSNVSVCV